MGGTVTSFSNTPQAKDDTFILGTEDQVQTALYRATFDVMLNDLGGAAKTLYSVDNGTVGTSTTITSTQTDLLTQDARAESTSTDTSFLGAKIWITADGKVGYDATAISAMIQGLNDGQTLTDQFTYAIRLGNGTLSWATAIVKINGANDAPTLDSVTAGSIQEVDQSSATNTGGLSGTLHGHDADAGDTQTYGITGGTDQGNGTVTLAGTYGTLTVNKATGAYTYTSNGAVEGLDQGETAHDDFTVTVTDSHNASASQTFTVNLTGADDAPTLDAVVGGSVTEVNQSSTETPAGLSGTLQGHDVDVETLTYGLVGGVSDGAGHVSVTGTYGTLTVTTATGAYSYAPNTTAIEALDDGAHPVDNFTFTVSDGDGPTVNQAYTVTINGADDAPTLAPVTAGSVTEVDQSSSETPVGLSGTLQGHDVDAGDTLTYGITGGTDQGDGTVTKVGTYGTLTVHTDTGAYSYAPNTAAIEALDDNAHPVDNFTFTVSDGDGPTVNQAYTVTINGADDAPTLALVTAGSVSEVDQSSDETPVGLSGTLQGHDVDAGDTLTYGISGGADQGDGTVTKVGTYGTLTVHTDTGAYSYAPNTTAIEALDDGAHPVDNFTVTVSDGDDGVVSQVYAVTINGADDAPTLAPVTAGSVTEVDQSSDETPVGLSGTLQGHDVDAGDTLTYGIDGGTDQGGNVVTKVGTYGTLTVHTDTGAYSYAPNTAAIEALDDNAHPVDNFTVTVSDGDDGVVSQTYAVTINGADDAPTLAPVTAGSVTEVDQSSDETPVGLSGTLQGHDVDAGDTLTYGIDGGTDQGGNVVTKVGTYGTLTVHTDTGAYSYAPNTAAIEALDDNAHPVDNFTVTVSDGDDGVVSQTYSVTINGADDAPTLAPVTAGSVSEVDQSSDETPVGLSGTLQGHDVDAGDTLTYGITGGTDQGDGTVTKVGTYGTLTVHTDTGAYSYAPNTAAIEALDDGAHPVDNFTVTVSDGDDGVVSQTYSVTINGADDAPTLAPVTAGSVSEVDQSSDETPVGLSGTLQGHDVDAGDTLTYGISGGADQGDGTVTKVGTYGTLTVHTDTGAYSYAPNTAAIEALDDGAHPVDNFTVTVSDGDDGVVSQTYSVTINGADDAPTLAAVNATIAEDALASTTTTTNLTGTLSGHDVDTGDVLTYGLTGGVDNGDGTVSVTTTYGVLTVTTATGHYDFTPNAAAIEALTDGAHPQVVVGTTVSDGDDGLVTSTFTLDLTGANDAPVAVADTGSAGENETKSFDVLANDTDVDAGDSKTLDSLGTVTVTSANAAVNGISAASAFSIDSNQVKFSPGTLFDHLAAGESATVTVDYTVKDALGASSTSTLTLTVGGVNDAPVLTGDLAATVNEGASVVLTTADIGFADVDDTASGVSFTISNLANGVLKVNGSAATTFTYADLSGGLVSFQHDGSETTSAGFKVVVEDGNEDASTPTASDFVITVTPVNDAPVNTIGSAVVVAEDTLVGLTGLSIADVDAGLGTVTTTLTVEHGYLLIGSVPGGAVADTSVFGQITLTGTVAQINASLADNNVKYQGAANFNGPDTFHMVTNDGGNTGLGGAQIDTDTKSITVTPVNDAPTAAAPATLSVNEDASVAVTGLSIADVDAASGNVTATLSVLNGAVTVGGSPAGVTLANNGTDTVTLTGTVAAINAALGNVAYAGSANYNGSDTLTLGVNDGGNTGSGGALTGSASTSITVNAVNDAPTAAAPATLSVNEDASVAVTGLSIADVDAASGNVVATLSVLNGAVTVGGSPAGVTLANNGTDTVTLTGTVAAINAALGNVAYAGSANYNGSDTLTLGVNDGGNTGSGGALTGSASTAITVNAVNDAPVNTIGSAFTVAEDTLVGLTGLSIADVDAASGILTTTLSVEHGFLLIGSVPGGAVADTSVFGQITLTGTVAQINASLADNNIKYKGVANFNGPDTFHMVTNDGGNTGSGGALIDTDTKSITVTAVNDAPTVAAPLTSTASEGDASYGVNLISGATDVDGDTVHVAGSVTYTVDGVATGSGGTTLPAGVTRSGDTLNVDPTNATFNHLAVGEHTTIVVSYTIADGNGGTVPQSATVTINGTNDTPSVSSVTKSLTETTATEANTVVSSGNLLTGDTDPDTSDVLNVTLVKGSADGSNITVTAGGVVAHGTYGDLTVNSTGTYSYKANAAYDALNTGQNPADVFTFTVSDGHGGTVNTTATFNITGTSDNTAPVAVADRLIISQGSSPATFAASALLANDTDADLDTLAIQSVSGGTVSYNSTTRIVTWTGGNGGSFSYTVSDGHGGTSSATVTVDTVAVGNGQTNDTINLAGQSYQGSYIDTGNGNDTITGSLIVGSTAQDTLLGGPADDSINGGTGNDTLTGGSGSDVFIFSTPLNATNNVDEITDFNANNGNSNADKIWLDDAIFGAAGPIGTLTVANFLALASGGNSADAGAAHIIFDRATGNLYYDSDGGTSANRTLFAHLTLSGSAATDVDNTDFLIF